MELQESLADYQAQGVNMAAISYDAPDILQRFAARNAITYPLLSDADSQVIRRFGLLNPNMPEGDPLYGVPFPGFYLLDPTGQVQAKSFLVDHTTRTTAAGLLMQQKDLVPNVGRQEIETPDLRFILTPATQTLRPGQSLLVRAELQVTPGLHLYGPEMPEGYQPTSVALSHPEVLLESQFRLPAPELRRIAALNETIPVYTGTVNIEADCILKPFASAGEYRLQGTLRYQACTDRECYLPQEVPFELPIRIAPTVEGGSA